MKIKKEKINHFTPIHINITIESERERQLLSALFGNMSTNKVMEIINSCPNGKPAESGEVSLSWFEEIYNTLKS